MYAIGSINNSLVVVSELIVGRVRVNGGRACQLGAATARRLGEGDGLAPCATVSTSAAKHLYKQHDIVITNHTFTASN